MSRFPIDLGGQTASEQSPLDAYAEARAQLARYPSLGCLFEGTRAETLAQMRQRLARTNEDLERVIRHGSDEDAPRAVSASLAYGAALALLDDLEALQKSRIHHS